MSAIEGETVARRVFDRWMTGILRRDSKWQRWYVEAPDGRRWDPYSGAWWIGGRPRRRKGNWRDKEIGVGVERCPWYQRVERQPRDQHHYGSMLRAIYAARLRAAGMTYAEIGDKLSVSRERARQLVERGTP